MAGKIIVSTLQSDTDNSISFVANTGATIFSANISHGIAGSFIADGSITAAKIADGAIVATEIADGAVTTTKIATSSITGNLIATNAISQNNIVSVNASVASVGTLPKARLPSNSVLQVVSTTKTNTTSFASSSTNAYVDITGMSVTITPISATSKILVTYTACVSQSGGATIHIRLLRDSTSIGQGDASGNRLGDSAVWRPNATQYVYEVAPVSHSFLDSPNTTSAITYKLQATLGATYSATFYLNRAGTDDNQDYVGRTASTITVMEIAG